MKPFIVIICISLTGCVGWGVPHQVLFKNEEKIIIQYDKLVESQSDVQKVAQRHCLKFDRKAELSGVQRDAYTRGLIMTHTFSCIAPKTTKAADGPKQTSVLPTPKTPGRGYYNAEKIAKALDCEAPLETLKNEANTEVYQARCGGGQSTLIGCEWGNCRVLQ